MRNAELGVRNSPPLTNSRAVLRHLIALLELQLDAPFLGQLKALLTGPELPVASDVAVPWDITYLNAELGARNAERMNTEFLTALVAALNDRAKLPDLDRFPEWRNQPPVPLDAPWPA